MSEAVDLTGSSVAAASTCDSDFLYDDVWKCFEKGPRDAKAHKPAWVKCNFCNQRFILAKKVNCEAHIIQKCSQAPRIVKDQLCQSLSSPATLSASLPPPVLNRTEAKRQRVAISNTSVSAPITKFFDGRRAPDGLELQELRQAQLLFFVMCNVPFRAASSPFFLEFIKRLRPLFNPAGTLLANH